MTSKISIITINYNNRDGLQKTIDSVLNQTFKNFEFIIIDGKSTDGSKELIEKNSSQLTHWLSAPDNGIYNAMNKGIRLATGEYLLFLNSGDYLAGADIVGKIDHEIDGSQGIYYGDIFIEDIKESRKVIFPGHLTFDFFVTNNLSHQATFIKRTLFDEIFYYNEGFKIVSDWEFLIYAICKQNVSYKHLEILTTIYDGSGISSNKRNEKLISLERDKAMQKHFPAFIEDYVHISQLKQKRVAQFFMIKSNPISWKIMKVCIKTIFFFLPKSKKV